MKKWKKTAVFAAFAVLACATVHAAATPDELLLQAVQKMNLDSLNNAIRQGANPNCMDTSDKSALMYACENQWYAGIKILLTTPGINVSQKNTAGQNAVMYAVKHCDNEVVLKQILGDGTVNKNDTDNVGNTVLMYAIENKSGTPVDLLLKDGADPSKVNRDGYDALMWAAKNKNGYATKRILDSSSYINWSQCDIKNENNAFMIACENGSLDIVRTMITGNNAFDPCWKNSKGQPSLIWLIDTRKSANIIKYIMEYCSPDIILSMEDDFGNDVEYYATIKENDFVLNELVKIERKLKNAKQKQKEKRAKNEMERNL